MKRTPKLHNRSGMAIIVALFFSFCMLVLFVSMMYRQSSTAHHNRLTLQERQAFFAARAAMQHFLVKAKLFPTELYDAVEFKQGKNPLANFSEFESTAPSGQSAFEPFGAKPDVYVRVRPERELDLNGQPRYFYLPMPGKEAFVRLGSYRNPDYRFLLANLSDSSSGNKYTKAQNPPKDLKPHKYLEYFIRDCTNMTVNGQNMQSPLEMAISTELKRINDWDIVAAEGYPYTMNYRVGEVQIQTIQGLRRYGEEAIEIAVEGLVKDFQGRVTSQTQKRTEKITRRGATQ